MSSAIEVLKEGLQNEGFVSNATSDGAVIFSKRFKDALGEALLALEELPKIKENLETLIRIHERCLTKEHKLKVWLEKEIVKWEGWKKEYSDKEKFEDYMEDLAQQRINSYKEVLGQVKP